MKEVVMSWENFYQRKSIIEAFLAGASAIGNYEIPSSWNAKINEVFGKQDEFLLAVHYCWTNTYNARLDMIIGSTF